MMYIHVLSGLNSNKILRSISLGVHENSVVGVHGRERDQSVKTSTLFINNVRLNGY